jgi:outer membrane receptor protein involved in Fe transport
MDPQQRWLSYARLQLQHPNKWIKETQITLAFQQGTEGRVSSKNGSTIIQKEKDQTQTVSVTANVFSDINKRWSANSGIEVYADRVKSSRTEFNSLTNNSIYKRGLYPNNATANNYSAYSLHHIQQGKWIVDAGLRVNLFNIGILDSTLGDVQLSPAALVSNVAVLYQLSQQQKLYASYSSGYRAPNIDDMGTLGIVDFRYEVPTANLAPEKSQHTEIGYKYQSKLVSATVAAYYMHLSNLITRVRTTNAPINGYTVYKKENTESAFIKGIEAELMAQLLRQVSVNAGFSYTYGQSLSKNEPLRRIPPFNGRMAASFKNLCWFASAEWQFASKQTRLAQGDKDDNRIGKNGTAGWQLINLYAGYHLRRIQLNMGLQNLFNQDYKTHGSGINGVGRSVWLSMSIKI